MKSRLEFWALAINFTIAGLTLTGGRILGTSEDVFDTSSSGGAIRSLSSGMLFIDRCIIRNNELSNPPTKFGSGGGVFAVGPVSLIASTVSENRVVKGNGGGVVSYRDVTITDSQIIGNTTSIVGRGGGIAANGHVSVVNSTIHGNIAGHGGGIAAGLYRSGNGNVTVIHSSISENQSAGGGIVTPGALYPGDLGGGGILAGGNVVLYESVVSQNTARVFGSGISAPQVTLKNSTVRDNRGGRGGGIAAFDITLVESTVSGNSAVGIGGGVWAIQSVTTQNSTISGNSSEADGGGIYATTVTINESTISGNVAGGNGGGIRASNGATISHSTVTKNGAFDFGGGLLVRQGTALLDHSIIAANTAHDGGIDLTGLAGLSIIAEHSLIGFNGDTGLSPAPVDAPDAHGNIIGGPNQLINPLLGPLADNGGPTLTHALLAGSPAINRGDPAAVAGVDGVPMHDQRGKPFIRIFGGRIDIGAVESLPAGFLPGDYNHNGEVDTSDYSMWRDSMGMMVEPGTGADGNGDGLVDNLDYGIWKSNLGATVEDLPPVPLGAAALAAQATSSEQVVANRGELATNALALATTSNVLRRRVRPSLRTLAAAHDDGVVAWSAAHRNSRRHATESVDSDIFKTCATEESPANGAFDAVFDLLGVRS